MNKSTTVILSLLAFCIIIMIATHYLIRPVRIFTLINTTQYQKITTQSTQEINNIIPKLKKIQASPEYITRLIKSMQANWQNRPYALQHANGESNWCSNDINSHICQHIQQDHIFRTDKLNCTTYVQNVLALINSQNMSQFKHHLVSIAYGALDNSNTISYFNRNHFTSTDFNRINEKHGLLKQVNPKNLKIKYITTKINHKTWFANNARHLATTVRVLNAAHGLAMAQRLKKQSEGIHFPQQTIHMAYLPKAELAYKTVKGYSANIKNINKLPTPSILEIVRDDKKWNVNGKNIKKIIHSGIAISHLGFIYKQHYKNNTIIYQKINCQLIHGEKYCKVRPRYCNSTNGCNEIMYTQATDAFPNHYLFYEDKNNNYHCSKRSPKNFHGKITTCNRIETLPLQDYILRHNYGKYTIMQTPSIVGIHIEKIT